LNKVLGFRFTSGSKFSNLFFIQVSKKNEEFTELQMKLESLEGECQTSGEDLKNKLEVMKKLNTELSTCKERVTNLTKENEVLEVKVLFEVAYSC
jgi:chromosome segregation ATPase